MNLRFLKAGRWADGIHRPQFDVEAGEVKELGEAPGQVSYHTAKYAVDCGHAEFTEEASPAVPSESTHDSAPANPEPEEDPTA